MGKQVTTPKRKTFSAPGTLTGMGREAWCTVMGTKTLAPDGTELDVLRVSIENEPLDLPDGRYVLSFENTRRAIHRRAGFWVEGNAGGQVLPR